MPEPVDDKLDGALPRAMHAASVEPECRVRLVQADATNALGL